MATENNKLFGIHPILGSDKKDRKLDIVFIHGLGGHAETTWGDVDNDFWLNWLVEDFDDVAVWTVGYDATPSAWIEDTMPMEDRAFNMLNDLSLTGTIGKRPIIFIVHSMGGLILKYMLEKSKIDDRYNHILGQTKGVVFLAVPHDGAGGANFIKALNVIFRANDVTKQLEKNASALDRLDGSFNTLVQQEKLQCISFFETKEIKIKKKIFGYKIFAWKGVKIVSKSSARGRFIQPEPIAIDKDHIEICKLTSRQDLVYRNIHPHIQKILDDIFIIDAIDTNYINIENSLSEPIQDEASSSVNQIFLIFNSDNISDIKYDVTGYIQSDNEFHSELIEFTFEDIYSKEEQESFVEKLVDEFESDVTIHFIIPPSLFLLNFKQWKYRDNELVKRYHIMLHNKDRFNSKIRKYPNMIGSWENLFDKHKDNILDDALIMTNDENTKFDTRLKKIGVCLKQNVSQYETVDETIDMAKIGIWQYPEGIMADYHVWIESDIYLKELNHKSRECDNMALLWDDMSLLEELKRRI